MKKTQHCQYSESITQGKKQYRPCIRRTIPACRISSLKMRRDPCMLSVLTTRSPRCASSLIRAYHSSLCELWRPSMTTRRALSASAAASRRLCYFSPQEIHVSLRYFTQAQIMQLPLAYPVLAECGPDVFKDRIEVGVYNNAGVPYKLS